MTKLLCGMRQNKPEFIQTSRQRLSWIPACAGMTTGRQKYRGVISAYVA